MNVPVYIVYVLLQWNLSIPEISLYTVVLIFPGVLNEKFHKIVWHCDLQHL